MSYDELTTEKLLKKLETAGRYPGPELIEAIWERREETEPLLLTILTRIATYYPETRDNIVSFFRSLLPTMEEIPSLKGHNDVWENVAGELGQLADEETRELVLALFEADLFAEQFMDKKYYLQHISKECRG